MEAPGKGLLKVVSILYIIFGVIMVLFLILLLFGVNWLYSPTSAVGSAFMGILNFGGILFIIAVVLELIMGIVGYKKSDEPSQANYFIVIGIILGIIAFISMISFFNIFTLIGFILPVLYIIGGAMNRRAAT